MIQQAMRWLFRRVWHRWVQDYHIVRVTGWRSCLCDSRGGQRSRITVCLFPWD